ncbi:MAG: GAF domain-containing sensor histidine kinase [Candidatus Omnitrophica bacterium]|nr:GAF domain-containing sensor histidine kinase [Candidatus Omnitrophota bacterium]MBU2473950.1 GAF domain-containing sensor histidine kinase [Candidatus Omnitrophota bacterium]
MALNNWLINLIKGKKSQRDSSGNFSRLKGELRDKSRDSLEEEFFKLRVAYEINRDVLSSTGLEEALNILVDRIAEVMSVEIVSLMLVGKSSGEMLIKFAKGLDKEIIRDAKVKLGEGVSGWVAQTGQSLLIKDISKDPRFPKRGGRYSTDSLLSVPLKVYDKVIGVINVNNKESGEIFNEQDLDVLNRIADLSAIAVVNVRFREDAKELDVLRSEFIANVSHELRTPLTALKESVGLVLDEITGSINEKQKKLLNLASQNIRRLNGLIDDLLDFSKAEAGLHHMKRTLFDITNMVKSATDTFLPLIEKKGLEIKGILTDKKIEIWGDEDKLYEVITNFIDNAVKYNKPRGKIKIKLEDADSDVKIKIADTGIGIPGEDLSRLFNRFSRLESSLKEGVKGTGLGLSIVKDIVEMHGGKIEVESKVDEGTTFSISLPKNLRIRR